MLLFCNQPFAILSGIFFFLAQAILLTTTKDDSHDRCRLGRLALRLSQAEFASIAGVSRWVYGGFERRTGRLSYEEQKLVAAVLMTTLGGNVRSYFPSFVPKCESDEELLINRHGNNPPAERAPSDPAGNRDHKHES
jgi:transcriptional regulator with XRE-family HTH domain